MSKAILLSVRKTAVGKEKIIIVRRELMNRHAKKELNKQINNNSVPDKLQVAHLMELLSARMEIGFVHNSKQYHHLKNLQLKQIQLNLLPNKSLRSHNLQQNLRLKNLQLLHQQTAE